MAELSIKNFPEDLLKRLKVAAAQQGITLRDAVIRKLSK
jgi:plasmid stability protein